MVSNPDLVFYACIARGSIILAEFTTESNLDDLVFRCIQKTPPHHSFFSHTVKHRVYIFLIKHPFVYFGIFHEDLNRSEIRGFLNRLRRVFEDIIETGSLNAFDNFTSYCFQAQFDSVFRHMLGMNVNTASSKTKQMSLLTKISSPGNFMMMKKKKKKKKKRVVGDANGEGGKNTVGDETVDLFEDINGFFNKDVSLPIQKYGSSIGVERQKAKQMWQKHVWVVLSIDLFVCLILFFIWLWVCRGFQCVES